MRPWAALAVTGFTVLAVLSLLPSRDPWYGIDAASLAQLEEHRQRGAALLGSGSPGKAAAEFQAIVRKRPRLALGQVNLAIAWLEERQHNPEALAAARKGVELRPHAAWPKVVLARALEANNRPAEALPALEAAVRAEPDNLRVHGALIRYLNRPEHRVRDTLRLDGLRHRSVHRLAELAPRNLVAQLEWLVSQVLHDEPAGARSTLKWVRKLYPREAEKHGLPALVRLDQDLATGNREAIMAVQIARNVAKASSRYRVDHDVLFGSSYRSEAFLMPGWDVPPPRFRRPAPVPVTITWKDVTVQAGLTGITAQGTAPLAAGDLALADSGLDGDTAYQSRPEILLGGSPPMRLDPAHPVYRSTPLVGTGSPVVQDLDGDAILDAYVAAPDGDRVWRNTRQLRWESHGITVVGAKGAVMLVPAGRTRGRGPGAPLVVDLDGDERPEIIRPSEAPGQPAIRYLQNERNFVFSDQTAHAGLSLPAGGARQAVFADFDGNGAGDLLVVRSSGGPRLFLNRLRLNRKRTQHEASFTDASRAWRVPSTPGSRAAVIGDFDRDGDWDVAVAGRQPHGTMLYRNDGERFVIDVAALAVADDADWIDFLDYDNDTWLDMAVAGPRGIRLLRNEHGTFRAMLPVSPRAATWVKAVDWDLDGDMDLLATEAGGRVRLLDNVGGNLRPWTKVELIGFRGSYAVGGALRPQTVWDEQLLQVTSPLTHIGLGAATQAIAVRTSYQGQDGGIGLPPTLRTSWQLHFKQGW